MLQNFLLSARAPKHNGKQKSLTRSKKHEYTLSFNVVVLYRDLFVALQVGNTRGDVVVLDDMKIDPTSFSIETM